MTTNKSKATTTSTQVLSVEELLSGIELSLQGSFITNIKALAVEGTNLVLTLELVETGNTITTIFNRQAKIKEDGTEGISQVQVFLDRLARFYAPATLTTSPMQLLQYHIDNKTAVRFNLKFKSKGHYFTDVEELEPTVKATADTVVVVKEKKGSRK